MPELVNVQGFVQLLLPAGVPGLGDYITPRAKRASVEVVKFKRLLMYFPFTVWNDLFACVDPVSGPTFGMIFDPSARCRRKLAWASGMPGSSTDRPDVMNDHTWSDCRNND
jgi:hypothetical protein